MDGAQTCLVLGGVRNFSDGPLLRYLSKVRAARVSSARPDLCGGCLVTGIPTAIPTINRESTTGNLHPSCRLAYPELSLDRQNRNPSLTAVS